MEKTKRLTRVCLAVVVLILVFFDFWIPSKADRVPLVQERLVGGLEEQPPPLTPEMGEISKTDPPKWDRNGFIDHGPYPKNCV